MQEMQLVNDCNLNTGRSVFSRCNVGIMQIEYVTEQGAEGKTWTYEGWETFHCEELHNLYSSNGIRIINSMMMRWAGYL
jgi:hypothetical protein